MSAYDSEQPFVRPNEISVMRSTRDPDALPAPVALRQMQDLPLRQAWLGTAAPMPFRPGWFRVRWHPTALVVDSVFVSPRPRNAARGLNQPTWELGEVAESFIEEAGASDYLEVHVTPENQRLQLKFPHGGIERLRAGEAALQSFMISEATWARSQTWIREDHWASRLILPSSCFRPGFLTEGGVFRGNFSRYDCADAGDPILSATAPLKEPSYHRRQEWQTFRFSRRGEPVAAG